MGSSHFQMGTLRHREGSGGHRARWGGARAGPTAPPPWGVWGDQCLLQDASPGHEELEAGTPRNLRWAAGGYSGGRGLSRPGTHPVPQPLGLTSPLLHLVPKPAQNQLRGLDQAVLWGMREDDRAETELEGAGYTPTPPTPRG